MEAAWPLRHGAHKIRRRIIGVPAPTLVMVGRGGVRERGISAFFIVSLDPTTHYGLARLFSSRRCLPLNPSKAAIQCASSESLFTSGAGSLDATWRQGPPRGSWRQLSDPRRAPPDSCREMTAVLY
ncbi:hypothetical protein BDA96_04G100000 [Sorghum bicolor]|uniref:Uncharacterized protein n=1 Tax=Sorghum bicolor TaxID=4558 RepID=A0A921R386_SORBI|nr:hypothetical protein BDA96_04G100000 [Sorghum bicolor]KAG0532341.1 hypothetical protein BDA96_04G100000 [Sorghum bicolor]